jgi:hypothetical protein
MCLKEGLVSSKEFLGHKNKGSVRVFGLLVGRLDLRADGGEEGNLRRKKVLYL